MESNLKRKLLGDSNIRGVEILNIKKGTKKEMVKKKLSTKHMECLKLSF